MEFHKIPSSGSRPPVPGQRWEEERKKIRRKIVSDNASKILDEIWKTI